MAQADFYILPAADEESRYRFLGKLATRAIGAGHQLYVLTDSQQQAERDSPKGCVPKPRSEERKSSLYYEYPIVACQG